MDVFTVARQRRQDDSGAEMSETEVIDLTQESRRPRWVNEQRARVSKMRRETLIADMKASRDPRYLKALQLAEQGLGWDDIVARTQLPKSYARLLVGLWA